MDKLETDGSLGPVEVALVEFIGDTVDTGIADALGDLTERGIVSILDLVIVRKDDGGAVEVIELAEADDPITARFADVDGQVMWLLSDDDISAAAEGLASDTIGVLVVWEHVWARQLKRAVRDGGGRLALHERLDTDAVAAAISDTPGGN